MHEPWRWKLILGMSPPHKHPHHPPPGFLSLRSPVLWMLKICLRLPLCRTGEFIISFAGDGVTQHHVLGGGGVDGWRCSCTDGCCDTDPRSSRRRRQRNKAQLGKKTNARKKRGVFTKSPKFRGKFALSSYRSWIFRGGKNGKILLWIMHGRKRWKSAVGHCTAVFSPPSAFLRHAIIWGRRRSSSLNPGDLQGVGAREWAETSWAELLHEWQDFSVRRVRTSKRRWQTLALRRGGACVGSDADSRMKDETRTALRNRSEWRNGARGTLLSYRPAAGVRLPHQCHNQKQQQQKLSCWCILLYSLTEDCWQVNVFRPTQTPLVCWRGQKYVFTVLWSSDVLH